MGGKTQAGYFLCNDCREKFTCRTATVMERSHIPLHKWLLAIHLMATSKKGMSAHQLMRNLGLGSYRTAWFLAHRIREAMDVIEPNKERRTIGGRRKGCRSRRNVYRRQGEKSRLSTTPRPRKRFSRSLNAMDAPGHSTSPTSAPRNSAPLLMNEHKPQEYAEQTDEAAQIHRYGPREFANITMAG